MTLRTTPGVVVGRRREPAAVRSRRASGTTLRPRSKGEAYAPGSHPVAAYRASSASYFATIGLRVLDGRGFTDDDRRGAPLVAVVNRTMAAGFWPGESPIGRASNSPMAATPAR